MEPILDGTRENTFGTSVEVKCSDCKYHYWVKKGSVSARCTRCGNIEYLQLQKASHGEKPLNLKFPVASVKEKASVDERELVARSLGNATSSKVEALLQKITTEWELWAECVKNFAEPEYHAAYLAFTVRTLKLKEASERYQKHRAVFLVTVEERWQAVVADAMLDRIIPLSLVQMERSIQEAPSWNFDWPRAASPYVRHLFWLAFGMLIATFFL